MKVTFDSNYVALCLRLCLVCVKAFLENIPFLENAIFRKCYFPERKMFSCVWLHFKKFSEKYFLVFGKEEGKDKPRKTWTKPRKKIINDQRSIEFDDAVLRKLQSVDRAVDRDRRRDLTKVRSQSTSRDRDLGSRSSDWSS